MTETYRYIQEMESNFPALTAVRDSVSEALDLMIAGFDARGKLLLCGNGGSAAASEHMAGELLKGFMLPRPLEVHERGSLDRRLADNLQRALPVIPLTSFSAFQSAFANDCDPTFAFAQLVWALGHPGDVLFGQSTSGDSENVIQAFKVARSKGICTIALTGSSGGRLASEADCVIAVPSDKVQLIQEYHLPVYHAICLSLEEHFFGR